MVTVNRQESKSSWEIIAHYVDLSWFVYIGSRFVYKVEAKYSNFLNIYL